MYFLSNIANCGHLCEISRGGRGMHSKKNKRKPTTEVNRLTIYIQYIHSRIPMAQDAYLKETELAKEARPQEFCWPRSPSILT